MKYYCYLLLFLCFSCAPSSKDPLQHALNSEHPAIVKVMNNLKHHEVQILYTEILRKEDGSVEFLEHSFQENEKNYFYPASTVKLPAAVLAMELLDTSYPEVTVNTPYTIARDTLSNTIADDVRQIFAVSDNEANNRLYELMGRYYMNKKLQNKGMSVGITHRLSTANAADSTRLDLLFEGQSAKKFGYANDRMFPKVMDGQSKGNGFMRNDSLIMEPMDFSKKNYFPLRSQQELLKRIFFPDHFSNKYQFQLSPKSREFLKDQMHLVPRKNGYDEGEYYDGYCKFFLFGDTKERIPDHIKIYNKVGYAYGTLTDNAYVVDEKEGIEFFLSATLLVNENGIFNDNVYEYDEIGIPFLAQLGREIHAYEIEKKNR